MERYTYEVFTTDWHMRDPNGGKRVNLCARVVQPFSSVSFEVSLAIKFFIEDAESWTLRFAPGSPIRRLVTIPCAELCPPERKRLKRKRLILDDGDAVSEKATAFLSGVLEAYPAVPSPEREGAASEFGHLARLILSDRRYACRRKLPVFVRITVVSTPGVAPQRPLPPVVPPRLEEGTVCAICLDELHACSSSMDDVACLPCSHFFHSDCVVPWLRMRARSLCPLCRAVVP